MKLTRNRQMRRTFGIVEARLFLAGSVKRNDYASRRFIEYFSMQTDRLFVLVCEATDRGILIQPPPEVEWLLRRGFGRLGSLEDQEWVVEKYICSVFFDELQRYAQRTVRFNECFDMAVCDREAGLPLGHITPPLSR